MPLALKLANKGFAEAIRSDRHLKNGVNTYAGHITYQAVADSQNLEHTPMEQLI